MEKLDEVVMKYLEACFEADRAWSIECQRLAEEKKDKYFRKLAEAVNWGK